VSITNAKLNYAFKLWPKTGLQMACRLNTSTHCTQLTFYFTAHQLTCISQLSQLHTTGTNWYQNHQKIILTDFNNPHHFLQTRDAIKHSFCRFLFISTSYTNGVNYMFFLLASKMTKLFKSLSTSRSFQPCHLVTYLEKKHPTLMHTVLHDSEFTVDTLFIGHTLTKN